MSKGRWRLPSRKVRLPRGSAILGNSIILHWLSSIRFLIRALPASMDSSRRLRNRKRRSGLPFLPFSDLHGGDFGKGQKFFADGGPLAGLKKEVDHIDR